MKKITADMIRQLQKSGTYTFDGVSREESKILAVKLARAASDEYATYGIARNAFGYYMSAQLN